MLEAVFCIEPVTAAAVRGISDAEIELVNEIIDRPPRRRALSAHATRPVGFVGGQ